MSSTIDSNYNNFENMKSYKHKDKRAHIPSQEEAGYEEANTMVNEKQELVMPLNPVTHRGQDPELFWLNKYGNDNREELLKIDIRSLYRHEHISPEVIMEQLYKLKEEKSTQYRLNDLFGNALEVNEEDKVSEYYKHMDGWSNRLIQGDSLLVMSSLLEREGMAGKVQCIYMDPPYGINYSSNWQIKIGDTSMPSSEPDEAISGEPEMIKAFRDTWELGIHSYLTYLRDRLLVSRELLTETGSIFIQISEDNLHLVRNILDEVFGSENFVRLISYRTKIPLRTVFMPSVHDYVIWYTKNKNNFKYRKLYLEKGIGDEGRFNMVELKNGVRRTMNREEKETSKLPEGARAFVPENLTSAGRTESCVFEFEFEGKKYNPTGNKSWKTNLAGMKKLASEKRLHASENNLYYVLYHDDYPVQEITNIWNDTRGEMEKEYVVQTTTKTIQRCILMATDPGDLILDPTCGSATTAYVSEQWGRRWITIDTSRIALNIAKTRLMTSNYSYYKLYDDHNGDVRQGFVYKKVAHKTMGSITKNEPAGEEILFDQPEVDNKKMRVAGPFTVETLQNFDPVSPETLDMTYNTDERFEQRILEHLKSAGIKNGIKNENAVFTRIDALNSEYLHYQGYYHSKQGEKVALIHIGPKFGTVSKQAVSNAIKECRSRGHADWLIILGFSFESAIENESITNSMGNFEVTKVRMHDDLMQEGLLKKDKKAASFVTIGEPDVVFVKSKDKKSVQVKIKGLDIYDPIKDEVKPRDIHDIAYWMVDDDYDGSNFIVKQVFFCGGDKDEFDKWKKGLSDLSESRNKRKQQLQNTLKIEIDDEAFDRLYGHESHLIEFRKGRKVAVRVISQFGEESTKVLVME